MQRASPCLGFDGQAEGALNFCLSTFPDSRVVDAMRRGKAGPGVPGSVLAMAVSLDGPELVGLNGGPQFSVTPAISMFLKCGSQARSTTSGTGCRAAAAPCIAAGWPIASA